MVAFVGLGLTSVKVLYQLFSSIKDGPGKLNDLAKATGRLQSALEQINDFPNLLDILSAAPSLARVLEECKDDVEKLEQRLKKLDIPLEQALHRKVWVRLKTAFSEKDFAHMLHTVTAYVDSLNFELSVIQT